MRETQHRAVQSLQIGFLLITTRYDCRLGIIAHKVADGWSRFSGDARSR